MEYYYEDGLGRVYKVITGEVYAYNWDYIFKRWVMLAYTTRLSVESFCLRINPKESDHPAFVKIRFYEDLLKED